MLACLKKRLRHVQQYMELITICLPNDSFVNIAIEKIKHLVFDSTKYL